MKKLLCLLSCCVLFQLGKAQSIDYQSDFQEAEALSVQSGKPLAILVQITPPRGVSGVLNALELPEIVEKFNKHFVNYKVTHGDSLAEPVIKKYKLTGFPVFVFVDPKGGVLFQRFGNWPAPMLNSMIDEAVAASKRKSLVEYDGEYQAGYRSPEFLREYIDRRIQAGITDNAVLIEQYVPQLSVKQLSNADEVLFILKAGPYIDGRAYNLVYAGQKAWVDSLFNLQQYQTRVAIQSRIINNSMASAIATKNLQRANMATFLLRQSWAPDYVTGGRYAEQRMFEYYKAVGDTTSYLRQMKWHYERYYMKIGVDSIRKLEAQAMDRVRSIAQEQAMANRPSAAAIQSVSYAMPMRNFAQELNSGAWSVYETGTRNPTYLSDAILWSRRSIELQPIAAYYDTLAHLLYRLDFHAEALATQEKAVVLARKENRDAANLEKELEKIKSRTL